MMSPLNYLVLYSNVQAREVEKYIVKTKEIKFAIKSMVEVYKPDPSLWGEKIAQVANYDDPAYRCAYLYKYAPLHTCLIQDMFIRALNESAAVINPNFWNSNNCINICSLGGGPGIDIIGVLSALHRKYGLMRCSAQIIESMPGWRDTFDITLEEFQNNHYGLSKNLTQEYFQFSYIVADLLGKMDSVVNRAIGSANLITMVKFLSAATCIDTAQMIKKIFNSMRHGAVVFIIDNASGGYSELVSRIAVECRMIPVFGPLQYVQYTDAKFNVRKYGSRSCFSTQVTVHLLMKPYALPAAEWDFCLKSEDYSSEDDSAVSFGTSGYDSDYSKNPKSFIPISTTQEKLNIPYSVGYDSSDKNSLMTSGFNLNASNSSCHVKCYDNFGTKPSYKNSNCEPAIGEMYPLADKLNVTVSERKECDSRFNYPLYELFPQNDEEKSKGFKQLLSASTDESEEEKNKKYAAPVLQIDLEKILFQEKTKTNQLTICEGGFEGKTTSHNTENILKENTTVERECNNCSKLKRIKWLQKMCKFCNT